MYHQSYIDSAMAGSDYLSLNNDQLVFPVGSEANTQACINISIVDDDIFEQEEMFTVEWARADDIGKPVSPGLVGTLRTRTDITITDNDGKP